jgi:hypothetical protein
MIGTSLSSLLLTTACPLNSFYKNFLAEVGWKDQQLLENS